MNINYNRSLLKVVCFISFFILLFISPILGMFWLILPSIYFLYKTQYKNIFRIWGFFFFSWYFVFTACLLGFDGPIWIKADLLGCGPKSEETVSLFFYINDKYLYFLSPYSWYKHVLGNFCMQTLMLLSLLSSKLGFSIYIPSILKGILAVFKFVFGGKGPSAQCSSEKKPDTSGSFSSILKKLSTTIFGEDPSPKVSAEDICKELKIEMYKYQSPFSLLNKRDRVKGDRVITYGEAGLPFGFMGKITGCISRNATKSEIEIDKILREAKK